MHNEDLMTAVLGDNKNAALIPLSEAVAAVDYYVRQGGTLSENGTVGDRDEVIGRVKRHIAHCAVEPAFRRHDFDEDGDFCVTVLDDGLIVPRVDAAGMESIYSEGVTLEKIVEDVLYIHDNRDIIESP